MKKFALKFVLICLFSLVFIGCQSADKNYIDTIYQGLQVIIPNHIEYLNKDPVFKPAEREVAIKACQELLELAKTAKEENKK